MQNVDKLYYRRRLEEDKNVVPYILDVLLLFKAHINCQYVTNAGWEQYLAKYLTKPEKILRMKFPKGSSETQRFLQSRLIG